MNSAPEVVEFESREPSQENLYYVALGERLTQETLPFLNATLRQLVVLSSAMLGGAVALSDKGVVWRGFMVTAMIFLLVSLASALVGMIPWHAKFPLNAPLLIRDAVQRATSYKTWAMWISAVPLALALVVLFIGVLAGA